MVLHLAALNAFGHFHTMDGLSTLQRLLSKLPTPYRLRKCGGSGWAPPYVVQKLGHDVTLNGGHSATLYAFQPTIKSPDRR
jgi:hypothetical protein